MRLSDILGESKGDKKKKSTVEPPKPRNFVAKHAQTSGAGSHSEQKYRRHEKHKGKDLDEGLVAE